MLSQTSSARPWGILVVDDDAVTLRASLERLRESGYSAAGAVHLEAAMSLVRAIPFDLLIADIRLRSDNGLKVIRLAREEQPAMGLIAITSCPDTVVEQECTRLGATHLVKPVDLQRLLRIVAEKVSGPSRQRRWARKHINGGFVARLADLQAKVTDMSYGGFRLELPSPPDSEPQQPVDVALLSFGLSVNAELVWTRLVSPSGQWMCGGALLETDPKTARAWRAVVDTLPKST